jgi:transcriptional/translational regulatory protein YebC/TACO1
MAAIEAGAQDLEPGEEGNTLFLTDPTDLDLVSRALPAHGFNVLSMPSWATSPKTRSTRPA